MAENGVAPPLYSQHQDEPSGVQILVTPANNAADFQVGYLGADDHASIEGEVQIKAVTIVLSTVESIDSHVIELATSEVLLFSSPSQATSSQTVPSIDPIEVTIESPIHMAVQIPRAIYRVHEPIPLYITIPPPDRSLLESEKSASPYAGAPHTSVLTRTGAACRFHSTRPVQIRLVLHPSESENGDASLSTGSITQATLLHHVSFHVQCQVAFTLSGTQSSSTASVSIPLVLLPPLAPAPNGDIDEEIDIAYHKKHDAPPVKTTRQDDYDIGEGTSRTTDVHSSALHSPPPPFFESNSFLASPSVSAPPFFDDSRDEIQIPPHNVDAQLPPPSFDAGHPNGRVDEVHDGHVDNPIPSSLAESGSHLPSFIESESEARAAGSETNPPFPYWVPDSRSDQEEFPSQQYDGISHSLFQSANSAGGSAHMGAAVPGASSHVTSLPLNMIDSLRLSNDPGVVTTGLAQLIDEARDDVGQLTSGTINVDSANQDISPPPPPAMDDPSDPPPAIDEGIHALSEIERDRRERAIVEAAVAGGNGGVHALSAGRGDAPPPLTPPPRLLETGTMGVGVVGVPLPLASQGSGEEGGRPPPYLGVSQPVSSPAAPGPPPYIDDL
ncbi:hypothetical protein BS47DRAFT_1343570 [Hydnum rufescens UP504]|uniref:Uncharacterized protein n=1 Tax=Hydnum rufescens UP504 TaxID=1448309 RepID=A0A9P6DWS8_9AGAM|nr:hypothetical protein BS47DRAFT_1343570 [Hydnum rufescens UP504]